MTNLLQFYQGLLLNTILFEVILRSIDDFLDDLLIDLALQMRQYGSLALPPPTCKLPPNKGITNSNGVRHDSDHFRDCLLSSLQLRICVCDAAML
ncbi:hypothetical protein KCU67_g17700, partial [Aureobasidium melanogenum]